MGRYSHDPAVQERYERELLAQWSIKSKLEDVLPNAQDIVDAIEELIDAKLARLHAGDRDRELG